LVPAGFALDKKNGRRSHQKEEEITDQPLIGDGRGGGNDYLSKGTATKTYVFASTTSRKKEYLEQRTQVDTGASPGATRPKRFDRKKKKTEIAATGRKNCLGRGKKKIRAV